MSSLGGTIRVGEWAAAMPSGSFNHAIKIEGVAELDYYPGSHPSGGVGYR